MLDTTILIENLRKGIDFQPRRISIITLIEVLRGISPEKREMCRELLLEAYDVKGLSEGVLMKYCEIHDAISRDSASIPDAILLIAATAIVNREMLYTKDATFQKLKSFGLELN